MEIFFLLQDVVPNNIITIGNRDHRHNKLY